MLINVVRNAMESIDRDGTIAITLRDSRLTIADTGAGVAADEYAKFLPGTRFLKPEEALARFEKKEGLETLYGSGLVADAFNVANKVYAKPQPVAEYLDGSLLRDAMGANQAAATP